MTSAGHRVSLSPSLVLADASCGDFARPFDTIGTVVPPDKLVLEVVADHRYECSYSVGFAEQPTETTFSRTAEPTLPRTDKLAEPQSSTSSGWGLAVALLAGVVAASVLLGLRRLR